MQENTYLETNPRERMTALKSSSGICCRRHHVVTLSLIFSAIHVPYVKNTKKFVWGLESWAHLTFPWQRWQLRRSRQWILLRNSYTFPFVPWLATLLASSHRFYLLVVALSITLAHSPNDFFLYCSCSHEHIAQLVLSCIISLPPIWHPRHTVISFSFLSSGRSGNGWSCFLIQEQEVSMFHREKTRSCSFFVLLIKLLIDIWWDRKAWSLDLIPTDIWWMQFQG